MAIPILAMTWGCHDSRLDSERLLPGYGSPLVQDYRENRPSRLVVHRMHGAPTGPLAFRVVTAAAVSSDGQLAIVDAERCSIVLIQRPEGRFLRRFGRCGAGDGEFGQIRGLAFVGEDLLIYDRRNARVVAVDRTGREAWRRSVVLPMGPGLQSMSLLDDSSLLVSVERVPDGSGEIPLGLVGIYDFGLGAIREWIVRDSPAANRSAVNRIRRKSACVGGPGSDRVVVVVNDWLFEALAISLVDGRERFHVATVVDWPHSSTSDIAPSLSTSAVCGVDRAAMKVSAIDDDGQRRTLLQVRTYDGRLVAQTVVADSASSAHGRLVAIRGDTVFFVSQDRGQSIVSEHLLVPSDS